MHYVESGAGTPLVLLHAFPVDGRMWDEVRPRLDSQVRVIAPDVGGLGASAAEVDEPGIDIAAAGVLGLLDRLELDRVVLGGCSMGGYVAMALLRAAPERVAGLLLADTKAVADDADQRANRLSVAERAEREGTAGWLAESSAANLVGRASHDQRPEVVARVRGLIEDQPAAGVAWSQRAMAARPDSTAVLRSFTGPALVVVGAEDVLTPPAAAQVLADAVPGGELVVLPEAGHLPPVETPEAFAAVVRTWLERTGLG
ncbi:alpha/beta fold hydrolase [Saccharopolyspora sp. CA-218241]|uniref:alpha/beta fold hydrolase n=1 Tax=Saccharopolyspora sp. CA-218241 TaxID=3240027 RepID=UPI003D965095